MGIRSGYCRRETQASSASGEGTGDVIPILIRRHHLPHPADGCHVPTYVAFYVTFEPTLLYSPRKTAIQTVPTREALAPSGTAVGGSGQSASTRWQLKPARVKHPRFLRQSPGYLEQSAGAGSERCHAPCEKGPWCSGRLRDETACVVRPLLPNLLKAERNEFRHDFCRLEDRKFALGHRSAHLNRLRSNEF